KSNFHWHWWQPVISHFYFVGFPVLMMYFVCRDNVTHIFDMIGASMLTGNLNKMSRVRTVESTNDQYQVQVSLDHFLHCILTFLGCRADCIKATKMLVLLICAIAPDH